MASVVSAPTAATKRGTVRKTKTVPNVSYEDFIYIVGKHNIIMCTKTADGIVNPVGVVDPEDFVNALQKKVSISTDVLPRNCILLDKRVQSPTMCEYLFVFEFEPKILSYNFNKRFYQLSMPYVQFYVTCRVTNGKFSTTDTFISCKTSPVNKLSDTVYSLPLHNIFGDKRVCWGSGGSIAAKSDESIGEYARRIANNFFLMSGTAEAAPDRMPVELVNYDQWEMLTKTNPNFIKNVGFYHSQSFENLINNTWNGQ